MLDGVELPEVERLVRLLESTTQIRYQARLANKPVKNQIWPMG